MLFGIFFAARDRQIPFEAYSEYPYADYQQNTDHCCGRLRHASAEQNIYNRADQRGQDIYVFAKYERDAACEDIAKHTAAASADGSARKDKQKIVGISGIHCGRCARHAEDRQTDSIKNVKKHVVFDLSDQGRRPSEIGEKIDHHRDADRQEGRKSRLPRAKYRGRRYSEQKVAYYSASVSGDERNDKCADGVHLPLYRDDDTRESERDSTEEFENKYYRVDQSR